MACAVRAIIGVSRNFRLEAQAKQDARAVLPRKRKINEEQFRLTALR